ncbi:chromatin remodelling complex subunit-like protein [Ophiostoma piceae UAMH 11346]|uniref:Chromatin remodelling complex subunit-like protein n=1 Tax=Ophiostoma piceae (strain UAMH 11346) TaxID=1262450 RepID=S3CRD7_OPHP1|nr:chromatin remodelling complex subunit-like protein [Ophiostoma piceae UAMH 11346]
MKPTKSGGITETPIQPPIVPPPLSASSVASSTAASAASIPPLPSMSSQPLPPHAQAHPAHSPAHPSQPPPVQRSYAAPPIQAPPISGPAPTQSLPPVKTPAKPTLKALPTVRDHTTDQLGPGNDEYLPREIDEAGEKKVLQNGHLLGGREYRCRTFLVPQRGDKLFMLATECARVLGYRDSYLLFNKNRSLFKIIANQVEKDDLVGQEILPFSYRSRQIAIVTARSMFRQFGSRVIVGGRRVRDDYWETKARKQGFTEADLAGEKRPGGSKAREAAAAEAAAAQNATPLIGQSHPEIVYSNTPGQPFSAAAPPPMPDYSDTRSRDYSSILKTGPRQEITGPPYQDRSQASPIGEVQQQAHHAADFNRSVNQQRDMRQDYMQSYWRRPHEQPPPPANLTPQQLSTTEASIPSSRAGTSTSGPAGAMAQPSMVHHSPQMMMTAAPYSQTLNAPSSLPSSIQRSSGMPQPPNYNYPPSTQMWPQTPQYSYSPAAPPHQQPHQPPSSSQMRHSSTSSQVPPNSLPYSGMPGMSQGYPSQSPALPYEQTPRQYMHPPGSGSPAVTQGWQGQQQNSSQWWPNQQQ